MRRAARQADLVALHTPFPLGDLGLAITPDVPLVVHCHADIIRQRRAARLLAPLIRHTLARAARVIVADGGMVAGLPVVNTALPTAVPRVARHGTEALTVPPGDAVALADALRRVLDDPGLAAALGAAGRARVAGAVTMEASRQGVGEAWRAAISA